MVKYESIRIIRRKIKPELSMSEFCELSGINISTLSNIEKGNQKPSPETLVKIGKALDIPAECIVWVCLRSELTEKKDVKYLVYKGIIDDVFIEFMKMR